MKLHVVKRAAKKKCEAKKLRREGFIPAVLYSKKGSGETLSVNAVEFAAFLRHVEPGHLPTSIFTIVDESGAERRVLVKEIQYNIINYAVTHLDFEELFDDQKINVKIPIVCTGQIECIGIKLGGVLRQVIRHLKVRCLGKDIQKSLDLNIQELGMRQSKRLSDLEIPETMYPLMDLSEVVAVIVKR